jgi:predicted amidohydrolase
MKVKICVLQFERAGNFKKNVEKARGYLEQEQVERADFALIGGEFSLNESIRVDPYPSMIELAKDFDCNIVAPINANLRRFPELSKSKEKGYSSMHVFNRDGEVVAIQEKQHFYWKERPWFNRGREVAVFEVDGVKIGLIRGLDILYPEYTQMLKEAEIIFCSTMAIDDMMFELVKVRALENQCYVVMSSFIGKYVGMDFIGNAAIIEPSFTVNKGMRMANQSKVLKQLTEEGFILAELDLDYVKKIKENYRMTEL